MNKLCILIIGLLLTTHLNAQEDLTVIAVGQADLEKTKILVENPTGSTKTRLDKQFMKIIRNDFSFYKKFYDVLEGSSNDLSSVKHIIKGKFSDKGLDASVEITAINNSTKEETLNLTVNFDEVSLREKAHFVSDQIYQALNNKKSIFQSKIFFVSDRTGTRSKPRKELYVMDFDGGNKKRLTFHNGTVISPAVSSDGTKVLYSLIKENRRKRNVNLYLMDIRTGKSRIISKRRGINSGAVFTSDSKGIVLTLSHQGNAEIYIMNLQSGALKRLTRHHSPDVDPSLSANGEMMTFLSGRPGKPMIYTMSTESTEKSVKRISFVGKFNATPRFSPDGQEIAFSSWLDTRFDIFRISANGENLVRLTKDFGSNEDPTYSKDGQFIGFSSQRVISSRKAVQNIYIMDRDGEIIGPVTSSFGNCITPRWSN